MQMDGKIFIRILVFLKYFGYICNIEILNHNKLIWVDGVFI